MGKPGVGKLRLWKLEMGKLRQGKLGIGKLKLWKLGMGKQWMGETEAMEAGNVETVNRETEAEGAVERKTEDVEAADG